jgi:hypothetical protein
MAFLHVLIGLARAFMKVWGDVSEKHVMGRFFAMLNITQAK